MQELGKVTVSRIVGSGSSYVGSVFSLSPGGSLSHKNRVDSATILPTFVADF
jgi:hypothetical protein